jgi:hypothetical protein
MDRILVADKGRIDLRGPILDDVLIFCLNSNKRKKYEKTKNHVINKWHRLSHSICVCLEFVNYIPSQGLCAFHFSLCSGNIIPFSWVYNFFTMLRSSFGCVLLTPPECSSLTTDHVMQFFPFKTP